MVNIGDKIQRLGAFAKTPLELRTKVSLSSGNEGSMTEVLSTVSHTAVSPATMVSGQVIFNNGGTVQQISLLRQFSNQDGAILMTKISDNGVVEEQCLTRLPQSSTLEKSHATLIAAFSETQSVGIVLDKSAQETYSCDGKDDIKLPLLITRKQDSIQTFRRKRFLPAVEEELDGKRRRIDKLASHISWYRSGG